VWLTDAGQATCLSAGYRLPAQHQTGLTPARFGGYLRCETCRRQTPVHTEDTARYLRYGWPACHGQTMRWWTQTQIDNGEVPV